MTTNSTAYMFWMQDRQGAVVSRDLGLDGPPDAAPREVGTGRANRTVWPCACIPDSFGLNVPVQCILLGIEAECCCYSWKTQRGLVWGWQVFSPYHNNTVAVSQHMSIRSTMHRIPRTSTWNVQRTFFFGTAHQLPTTRTRDQTPCR